MLRRVVKKKYGLSKVQTAVEVARWFVGQTYGMRRTGPRPQAVENWTRAMWNLNFHTENFLGDLFPLEMAACVGPRGALPLYSHRAWEPPHGRIYEAIYRSKS
jgi:hypothetical protein